MASLNVEKLNLQMVLKFVVSILSYLITISNFLNWRNPLEGRSTLRECTKTHLRELKIETLGKEKGEVAGTGRDEGESKWDIMITDKVE